MIAICSALDVEYEALCKTFDAKSQNAVPSLAGEWGIGKGNTSPVLLIRSQVGKTSAEQHARYFLKNHPDISLVISCGIAGALSPDLKIGDILCGDIVKEHPDKAEALTLEASGQREAYGLQDGLLSDTSQNGPESCCKGVIVSSDVMVGEPALRDELYRRYSGSCVEMESAGVLRACVESHCSFLAVKVISDYADNRSLLSILRSQRWIMENLAHRLRAAL